MLGKSNHAATFIQKKKLCGKQNDQSLSCSKSWYGSEEKPVIFPIIDAGSYLKHIFALHDILSITCEILLVERNYLNIIGRAAATETKDVAACDISKLTISDKVIQNESLESVGREIILKDDVTGDISEMPMIQKEKLRITTDQESTVNVVMQKITLISGEFQVRMKPEQTAEEILKMDLESETESINAESDFVVLNQDQEEWTNEDIEGNRENEDMTKISLSPQESKETTVWMESKIQEGNEQLFVDMYESSLDDVVKIEETKESARICNPGDRILEVITVITEVVDFKYRKEHGIRFENVTDMNYYIRQKFAINRYFRLANVFDIILDTDSMMGAEIAFALYENIVRAVLLYCRMNGFLLLRCIIDNPTFDTTIYEMEDIKRELKFLKSVYSDVEICLCLQKQGYRKEFVSCIFLFEIVEFIKRNEMDNLLARGVVKTVELHNFFNPNLFVVTRNDVEKLYQTNAAIVAHFDLLTDNRFFTSNLYAAKQTMKSKSLVVKYVNIHFQLSFFKLLMRHIATLSMEDLDKLTDLKLCYEESRKDDCHYNILQAQETIRNEYGPTRGIEKLARNLCCQLIFYSETDWFWSEIIRLINLNIGMSFSIVKVKIIPKSISVDHSKRINAFQLLPTVTEYLLGRKEPKNKTSLNLFYFIKEFLMVVPHTEFISHRYGNFISNLCGSILNPATIINRILIPNLKKPIRKICAAVTIGKLLDSSNVNIAWSFDYNADSINYDDENTITETEEKVEVIRLIGAIYSQYTFPLRNTVHGARYFYIDFVLSKLEKRLTRLNAFENSFTPNALKYLDELIAKKKFTWQANYYLLKILLRKLLAAREITLPEKPRNNSDQHEYIEWLNQLFPIIYAGVKSKAFFALAFLIDGFFTNSDLECAFVLRFNDIPEFSFIEFLVLFKIFMRSNKFNRFASLCKHAPGRYGTIEDRSLQEMVKWLFRLINRVHRSRRIDDIAILHAKHRVLHWAEAYVANSQMLGTDDAKAMLRLLKWRDEPGLKDDELNRGIDRLSFEIYQKSLIWPDNLTLEMIQAWSLYGRSTEQVKQYLKNYIPPACPSSIKVYRPTRLLQNNPIIRPEALSPWRKWQMNRFLKDTIEFHRCEKGSKMRGRKKSGSGTYGYARLLYLWSIDGIKLMPFSTLKNECDDLLSDLSELDQRRNIPFDLQAEVGSIWQTFPSKKRDVHFQQERNNSSQSVNLPISHDNQNETFRMQISYDPRFIMPVDVYDHEINFGASAANLKGNVIIKRTSSLPNNFSNFSSPVKKVIPSLRDLLKQQMSQLKQDQKQKSRTLRQKGASDPMKNPRPTPLKMFGKGICPTYCSISKQKQVKKERTLFHLFLEAGESCKNCGLIDHTEIFCPKMPNYSNLLDKLLPVTYKWTIKKEKAFENLHRQDSWGTFGDEEDD